MKTRNMLSLILVLAAMVMAGCGGGGDSGSSGPLALTTVAGKADTKGAVDDIGTAARFNLMAGLVSDGTYLYVADRNNRTIRKVDIASGVVTTLAGTAGEYGSNDGPGSVAHFGTPEGLALVGGTLYVTDSGNYTIRKVDIASGAVSTFAGTAGVSGTVDGIGTAARFKGPNTITSDGTNLYVTETTIIRKIEIASGNVTTLAVTDGTGAPVSLYAVLGGATDGKSFFFQNGVSMISKIDLATNVITTIAGTAGVRGIIDGVGSAARLHFMGGFLLDGTTLYFSDDDGDTAPAVLRKLDIVTGEVTTLAVNGDMGADAALALTKVGKAVFLAQNNQVITKVILP